MVSALKQSNIHPECSSAMVPLFIRAPQVSRDYAEKLALRVKR